MAITKAMDKDNEDTDSTFGEADIEAVVEVVEEVSSRCSRTLLRSHSVWHERCFAFYSLINGVSKSQRATNWL